jgi:hypothetical protein
MTTTIDLLEERLERMERFVFGNLYDGKTAIIEIPSTSNATSTSTTTTTNNSTDLTTKIRNVQTSIPTPKHFLKVYEHYKTLGLSNDHDVRRLLAAPLDTDVKIDIILANSRTLKKMALTAETILNLKDFISGDAWFRAKDELPRLKKVEAEAAEVLESSAQLMHRVDSSLEHYDRAVELVSEKMVTAAAANE